MGLHYRNGPVTEYDYHGNCIPLAIPNWAVCCVMSIPLLQAAPPFLPHNTNSNYKLSVLLKMKIPLLVFFVSNPMSSLTNPPPL